MSELREDPLFIGVMIGVAVMLFVIVILRGIQVRYHSGLVEMGVIEGDRLGVTPKEEAFRLFSEDEADSIERLTEGLRVAVEDLQAGR